MSVVQKTPSGTWRRYSADDGGYYYHNEETDQSVWDPPPGWVEPEHGVSSGVAMDTLGPDGRVSNASVSQPRSASPSTARPQSPSVPQHQREPSAGDTALSPEEAAAMRAQAGRGSSAAHTAPVQQTQAYEQHREEPAREKGPCCPACPCGCGAICACCLIFFIIAIVVVLAVVLTLPETVSCHSGDSSYFVNVVDPPIITSISPAMVCTYYNYTTVYVQGSGFLKYNDDLPTVTIDSLNLQVENLSNCTDLDVRKENVKSCTSFQLTIPLDSASWSRNPTVTIVNPRKQPHPAASVSSTPCQAVAPQSLLFVRAPQVIAANPVAICQDNVVGTLTYVGGPYLQYKLDNTSAYTVPIVTVNGGPLVVGPDYVRLSNCTTYPLEGYYVAETCSQMDLTIIVADYQDLNTLQVQNPGTANCLEPGVTTFRLLSPPFINTVYPAATLWGSATTITLTGGFAVVDGVGSTISVDGVNLVSTFTGCAATNVTGLQWCQNATATINTVDKSGTGLTYYVPTFTVNHPAIAGCVGSFTPLATFPLPLIAATQSLLPAFCPADPTNQILTINGNFAVLNGQKPTFMIGTFGLPSTRVNPAFCTSLAVSNAVQLCTTFYLSIPPASTVTGGQSITVTHPAQLGGAPVISSFNVVAGTAAVFGPTPVTPATLCVLSSTPANLTLAGTFTRNAGAFDIIQLVSTSTVTVPVVDSTCTAGTPDTCTQLVVTVTTRPTTFTGTTIDITACVTSGCCTTSTAALTTLPC